MSNQIVIPPRREGPQRVNPQSLLVYGNYKTGKTSAAAALPETLVLELQPGGADFVPGGWFMSIEKDIKDATGFINLLAFLREQRDAGKPVARRLVIDHIGVLDDWLFDLALEAFFATPIGRGYRTRDGGLKRITDLPSAGSAGGSPGWAWYWEQLQMMHTRILNAAEEVIYIGHVRDKSVAKEQGDVVVQDIDLTGQKARRLFCGQSSAIAFLFRRNVAGEDQTVVTFKTSETTLCGASCPHLTGREFVIGRSRNGEAPVFDWSAIYRA